MKTLVMKFGGAAFASLNHFKQIATIILERKQEFSKIVIVVSAMAQTTDQLIHMALSVNSNPPQREYDMLISAGERISMSLLAMALAAENQSAISFTGSQSGIITCSQHTNAHIIDVRPFRLIQALEQENLVIVAGFQGVSESKEITTLGRGGSDTTAVALALAIHAEKVEFYKDVNGICDQDPKIFRSAQTHAILTYPAALEIVNRGAKVLHPRAIQLAAKNGLPLHVRSFMSYKENLGTLIFNIGQIRAKTPLYERV